MFHIAEICPQRHISTPAKVLKTTFMAVATAGDFKPTDS